MIVIAPRYTNSMRMANGVREIRMRRCGRAAPVRPGATAGGNHEIDCAALGIRGVAPYVGIAERRQQRPQRPNQSLPHTFNRTPTPGGTEYHVQYRIAIMCHRAAYAVPGSIALIDAGFDG